MARYFNSEAQGRSSTRVVRPAELPTVELTTGITAAVLLGDRLNINVVTLEPGAVAPVHVHDEEQMGYVVAGSCDFSDGSRSWRLEPGDTYHAPSGAAHGAIAHGDGCLIIDVFCPPRAGIAELLAPPEG